MNECKRDTIQLKGTNVGGLKRTTADMNYTTQVSIPVIMKESHKEANILHSVGLQANEMIKREAQTTYIVYVYTCRYMYTYM